MAQLRPVSLLLSLVSFFILNQDVHETHGKQFISCRIFAVEMKSFCRFMNTNFEKKKKKKRTNEEVDRGTMIEEGEGGAEK